MTNKDGERLADVGPLPARFRPENGGKCLRLENVGPGVFGLEEKKRRKGEKRKRRGRKRARRKGRKKEKRKRRGNKKK